MQSPGSLPSSTTSGSAAQNPPTKVSMGKGTEEGSGKKAQSAQETFSQGYASTLRPPIGPNLNATCPMVCSLVKAGKETHMSPTPILSLHYSIDCHVATAFVTCTLSVAVPGIWPKGKLPSILFFPHHYDATITNVKIENSNKYPVFTTMLVPNDEARKYSKGGQSGNDEMPQFADFDPELFMVAFGTVTAGDRLTVVLTYLQPLSVDSHGAYSLQVASVIPDGCLAPGDSPKSVVSANFSVNLGRTDQALVVDCPFHPFICVSKDKGSGKYIVDLDASPMAWSNDGFTDLKVSYLVWGIEVSAACLVRPPEGQVGAPLPGERVDSDGKGDFMLMVAPTRPEVTKPWARSAVFVIDRSGSMNGGPMEAACSSIITGIEQLTEADDFTIIAFDHEQLVWSEQLERASPGRKVAAIDWVEKNVTARGLTDIDTPLNMALTILEGAVGLPCIFLLTDGAVEFDKDICRNVTSKLQDLNSKPVAPCGLSPRISTFAIGPFCNHYFLRQLALVGRGQFDMAYRPHSISLQMTRMLAAAAMPILAQITIKIDKAESVELFPFPIPDLFCGLPLVVAGKYSGTFPQEMELRGQQLNSADDFSKTVTVTNPATQRCMVPIDLVFMKGRLDNLTAQAWLCKDDAEKKKLEEVVAKLSYASNIPTLYTTAVGLQCSKENYSKLQAEASSKPGRGKASKYAVGGAAGVVLLGGLAAGMALGDVGGTIGNLFSGGTDLSMDGIADAFGGFDVSGVGDCCGAPIDACGDCCEAPLDMCGACCESPGDILGHAIDCCSIILS